MLSFFLLIITFTSLFTFISLLLSGSFIGKKGTGFISVSNILFCVILTYFLFYNNLHFNLLYYIDAFSWMDSGLFNCKWSFFFDTLTIVMLFIILTISLFVQIYSISYMQEDAHFIRFMSYLSFFTFFMIILVTANNFLQMFVGWEGVGFCSFLLINFWHTRLQANKSAIKAMIVNRVSDFTLVIGFLILFLNFKCIDYASVFALIPLILNTSKTYFFGFIVNTVDIISLLLYMGAMGKSAQVLLHTWLPDAMEGPTPVSALIHAATMVTAGVFLVVRCSPIFDKSPLILNVMAILGGITAFFAGTIGLAQNDIKRVIAYSTCSQLGYMFLSCGVSNYSTSVFHLYNHAFFKALLFLSSGAVIHALSDEQDMRKMGGLRRILPFTYMMFIIGSLALIGFPFLTGFYSKDVILEVSYACYNNIGHFIYWLGVLAAMCTAFYSTRLIYFVFITKTNSFKKIIIHAHEGCIKMILPLSFLALGSLFIGYLSKDFFIGLGSTFWGNSIYINPNNIHIIDAEFLPTGKKLLPVILSICSVFLAVYLYCFNFKTFFNYKLTKNNVLLYNFFNRKWYFDKIYNEYIIQNVLDISYNKTYKLIDRGLIETCGPFGFSKLVYFLSNKLKFIQSGYVYHYSLFLVLGCLFALFSITLLII